MYISGTPKYIANKIKSKGLQKLRWFCQMCEKQCRDEVIIEEYLHIAENMHLTYFSPDHYDFQILKSFSGRAESKYIGRRSYVIKLRDS